MHIIRVVICIHSALLSVHLILTGKLLHSSACCFSPTVFKHHEKCRHLVSCFEIFFKWHLIWASMYVSVLILADFKLFQVKWWNMNISGGWHRKGQIRFVFLTMKQTWLAMTLWYSRLHTVQYVYIRWICMNKQLPNALGHNSGRY